MLTFEETKKGIIELYNEELEIKPSIVHVYSKEVYDYINKALNDHIKKEFGIVEPKVEHTSYPTTHSLMNAYICAYKK